MNQSTLRKAIREQRRSLTPRKEHQAANQLVSQASRLDCFRYAKRVAFYLANDGEIDPALLLALAQAAGKNCYLPVLHPLKHNRLYFAAYRTGTRMTTNRYGIPEPDLAKNPIIPAWTLDIIFLPLAAFDSQCHRIGMGGGFYDRTLAFKHRTQKTRPLLIGLAYHFQQVDNIAANPWDIPLDAVVTDEGYFYNPRVKSPFFNALS